MTERKPLGVWPGVLCALGILQVVALLIFMNTSPTWFQATLEDDVLWFRLAIGWGTVQLTLFLLGLAVARRAVAIPRGTVGRARTIALGTVGAVHAVVTSILVGTLLWASKASVGHVLGGSVASLLFGLTRLAYPDANLEWISEVYYVAKNLNGLSSTLLVALSASCWFLIPPDTRERFWWVFDGALLIAFIVASAVFPFSPSEGDDVSLAQAVVRVSLTALLVARLSLRLVGPLLTLFERIGFRSMVAARHLRAKKTGFLAASGTLSILAVAVSSCMLISVLSVMGGFRADLTKKILGNHAHIVIDRSYEELEDWEPILDKAATADGVIGATPYLQVEVMVSSLSSRAGAILRGIDPKTISDVTDLGKNMTHGDLDYLAHPERILDAPVGENKKGALDAMLEDAERTAARGIPEDNGDNEESAADAMPGLVVGQELARALRLVVGDRVTVVSPRGDLGPTGPIPNTRSFRIAGIFYSGMYEYDMKHAYIDLEVAQRFFRAEDKISGIEIKLDDVEEAPELAATLGPTLGRDELRVRDWKMMNQQLFGALALEKLAMFITLGIAILIAGFSVFGTLTLLVQEKRREVGILKTMGTSARGVIRIFVIEGLLIGLAGGLMGLGLGFVLTFAAEHFGIRMNPEVYYIDKLPVHLDPTEFALVGAATVVVCLAATLFPAYQASRVRPVDALRYD